MNIVMISIDKKIFDENSAVRRRMLEYGTIANKLHIIILNKINRPFRIAKIGANVYLHPTNSNSKLAYFLDAFQIARELKNIDLITAQDPSETGFIAWRIAKKLKFKLELQIHTDVFSPYFIKHSWANRIRNLLARFLLPKADGIRVVSKRIKQSLPDKIQQQKPITVLPIFSSPTFARVSAPKFDLKQKYPQFKFIILMLSRLEKEKNIPLAISALKEVVNVFPKTGLFIVGDGSEKKALKRKARSAGLEEQVIFKRWTDDAFSYYKTADIFVSTSCYEGYGLTLVEAILARCPILTTKVGIVGEILSSNNSFLCDIGDKKCLVVNLIKAQQYPELLTEMKEKAFADFTRKATRAQDETLRILRNSWQEIIEKK